MTWLTSRLTKKKMKQRKVRRRRSVSQPSSSAEDQCIDELEEEFILQLEEGEAIAGEF